MIYGESQSSYDQNFTKSGYFHLSSHEAKEELKMLFLSLSLNQSMRYFVSVTKGWLLKRGSRYAESRQIQMQTLQKCLFLRRYPENSCDDSTLQDKLLFLQPV